MAYSQWIDVKLSTKNITVSVTRAVLEWGKFYKTGDKDDEISPSSIDDIIVHNGETAQINSCGRENSSSGTQGKFTLLSGEDTIGVFHL